MRILRAAHLGMCFGVRDAIALAVRLYQLGEPRGEAPNAQVGVKIDATRFFSLFYDTLAMYG